MANFEVWVNETFSRKVAVEASSDDEALTKARAMYRNKEIVLTDDDYEDTDFIV